MIKLRGGVVGIMAGLAVVGIAFAGATRGVAQDTTPTAGSTLSYPNHIHQGTCDNLNPQPLVALADLTVHMDMMGAMAAATPMAGMGSGAAVPAIAASTKIDLPLSDILASEHAINVHDAADPSIYIACGAIGGVPDGEGNLFIGLQAQNDSGFSGVAWLLDDGSGSGTTVTVFLVYDGMTLGQMMSPAMATPQA